jgi:Family of unknown function (DUF6325)
MTDTAESSTEVTAMGPVDYLIVEFPPGAHTGEKMSILIDLVERGIIRILDLTFVEKQDDGSVVELLLADLDGDGELDLAVFEGVSSGLVGGDDLVDVAAVLEPGASAGILIYENAWAAPFVDALRRSDAQVVASGRIPFDELADLLGDDNS